MPAINISLDADFSQSAPLGVHNARMPSRRRHPAAPAASASATHIGFHSTASSTAPSAWNVPSVSASAGVGYELGPKGNRRRDRGVPFGSDGTGSPTPVSFKRTARENMFAAAPIEKTVLHRMQLSTSEPSLRTPQHPSFATSLPRLGAPAIAANGVEEHSSWEKPRITSQGPTRLHGAVDEPWLDLLEEQRRGGSIMSGELGVDHAAPGRDSLDWFRQLDEVAPPVEGSRSKPSPTPWASERQRALDRLQTANPRHVHKLQDEADLYGFLDERGPPQGLDALVEALVYELETVEDAFKYLDSNGNGELSLLEFTGGMSVLGLNVRVICGMDEGKVFRKLDVNKDGVIKIEEMLGMTGARRARGPGKHMKRVAAQQEAREAKQRDKQEREAAHRARLRNARPVEARVDHRMGSQYSQSNQSSVLSLHSDSRQYNAKAVVDTRRSGGGVREAGGRIFQPGVGFNKPVGASSGYGRDYGATSRGGARGGKGGDGKLAELGTGSDGLTSRAQDSANIGGVGSAALAAGWSPGLGSQVAGDESAISTEGGHANDGKLSSGGRSGVVVGSGEYASAPVIDASDVPHRSDAGAKENLHKPRGQKHGDYSEHYSENYEYHIADSAGHGMLYFPNAPSAQAETKLSPTNVATQGSSDIFDDESEDEDDDPDVAAAKVKWIAVSKWLAAGAQRTAAVAEERRRLGWREIVPDDVGPVPGTQTNGLPSVATDKANGDQYTGVVVDREPVAVPARVLINSSVDDRTSETQEGGGQHEDAQGFSVGNVTTEGGNDQNKSVNSGGPDSGADVGTNVRFHNDADGGPGERAGTLDGRGRRRRRNIVEPGQVVQSTADKMLEQERIVKTAFMDAASIRLSDGTQLMNRPDLHRFFADLALVDPKRRRKANRQVLDSLYDEAIQLQVDLTRIGMGLTFWSFKVLLNNVMKELGNSWMGLVNIKMAQYVRPDDDVEREGFGQYAKEAPARQLIDPKKRAYISADSAMHLVQPRSRRGEHADTTKGAHVDGRWKV